MDLLITGFNKDIDETPKWFTKKSLRDFWKSVNTMSSQEYLRCLTKEPGFKKTLDTLEKRGFRPDGHIDWVA